MASDSTSEQRAQIHHDEPRTVLDPRPLGFSRHRPTARTRPARRPISPPHRASARREVVCGSDESSLAWGSRAALMGQPYLVSGASRRLGDWQPSPRAEAEARRPMRRCLPDHGSCRFGCAQEQQRVSSRSTPIVDNPRLQSKLGGDPKLLNSSEAQRETRTVPAVLRLVFKPIAPLIPNRACSAVTLSTCRDESRIRKRGVPPSARLNRGQSCQLVSCCCTLGVTVQHCLRECATNTAHSRSDVRWLSIPSAS